MSPEINNIQEDIKDLRSDVKANTELTRRGFEKMNGRVKKLELREARQEGARSVLNKSQIEWQTVAVSLAKSAPIALGLAYIIAEAFLK